MNTKDHDDFLKRPTIDLFNKQKKKRIAIAQRWATEQDVEALGSLASVAQATNEDVELRQVAIKAIGVFKCESAVTTLQRLVVDPSVSDIAVAMLQAMGDRPAICALIEAWAEGTDSQVVTITHALQQLDVTLVIDPLISGLIHPSSQVRNQAKQLLIQTHEAIPSLVLALKDLQLCESVQEVLAKIGVFAVTTLITALASKDSRQAEKAGSTLIMIGPSAVKPLLASLATRPENMQLVLQMMPAVEVAFENVSPEDAPLLQSWFNGSDLGLRNVAARALPKLGASSFAFFNSIVRFGYDASTADPAEYMTLGQDKDYVLLVNALGNSAERVRRAAASAILCMDEPRARALWQALDAWHTAPAPVHINPDGRPDAKLLAEVLRETEPGAAVFLMDGTYKLSEPLEVGKPILLIGISGQRPVITGDANQTQVHIHNTGVTYIGGITFSDCSLNADAGTLSLFGCYCDGKCTLTLSADAKADVTDSYFVNNPGDMIVVKDTADAVLTNNVCHGEGICISFEGTTRGTVVGNQCQGLTVGIKVSLESNVDIKENQFSDTITTKVAYTSADVERGQAAFNYIKVPPNWDAQSATHAIESYGDAIAKARMSSHDKLVSVQCQLADTICEISENYINYYSEHKDNEWLSIPILLVDQALPFVSNLPEQNERIHQAARKAWYQMIAYCEDKGFDDLKSADTDLRAYLSIVDRALTYFDANDSVASIIDYVAAMNQMHVGAKHIEKGLRSPVLSKDLEIIMHREDRENKESIRKGVDMVREGMARLQKHSNDEDFAADMSSAKNTLAQGYFGFYLLSRAYQKASKVYRVLEEAVAVVPDNAHLWAALGVAYEDYDKEIVDEYNARGDLGNTLNAIDQTITRSKRADLEKKIYKCVENARRLDPETY